MSQIFGMNTLSIEIPSLLDNIRIIESFIDNIRDKYELNDDIYGNIMIAITETVGNAIYHGNKGDKSKLVRLSVKLDDDKIVFYVTDQGKGFDYSSLPDPTSPENLEKIGGRGVFLMKHLADEVHFWEEGRKVELIFYLG